MALTPLGRKLAAQIAVDGPIVFHDYMTACLYDPDYGYYTRAAAIGRHGDFITAPEISQVFGELIGLWAGEVWRQMGSPNGVRLIELGPGRGTLMADALRALTVLPDFLRSATIHLVETSISLREQQRQKLYDLPGEMQWHAELAQVPPGPSIIVANEFVDCLAVQQFIFDGRANIWRQRMVDFSNGRFKWNMGGSAPCLPALPCPPDDGDIVEHRPSVSDLLAEFAARAASSPLAALIIDYGYERPSFGDTIQAVRAHRFADVFHAPGETDLTAHVDFASLKSEAENAGLTAFGPMPMGQWLLRLGIEARASQLLRLAPAEQQNLLRAGITRLIDPSQMGALFKVVSLTHGISAPPPPFI